MTDWPTPGQQRGTWGEQLIAKIEELVGLRLTKSQADSLYAAKAATETAIARVDPGDDGTDGKLLGWVGSPGVPDWVDPPSGGPSPGDNGDIVATAGGVITNVKPGRIDARARGGVGDGSTDNTTLLASLATEAATNGAELWVPEGIYRGSIDAASNLRVAGTGTIKVPDGSGADATIKSATNAENILIEGVTINGNGITGGIGLHDGTSNAKIRNVTIINTSSTAGKEGVRLGHLAHDVMIDGVTFDSHHPILLYNVYNVTVQNCVTVDSIANAITVWAVGGHDGPLRGLQLLNNRMLGCNRMGIEVFSSDHTLRWYESPVISGNHVQIADDPASLGEAFGYSTPGCRSPRIVDNSAVWLGSGTRPAYGFEIYGQDQIVERNYAFGFREGVMLNSAPFAIVRNNMIEDCVKGINTYDVVTATWGCLIDGNTIRNPVESGIELRGLGGNTVSRNTIIRDKAYSGDGTGRLVGIKLEPQKNPSLIAENTVVQGQASPTSGFVFNLAGAYISALGDLEETTVRDNRLIDLKTGGAMANPFFPNAGDATTADIAMTGNLLINEDGDKSAANAFVYV